MKSGDVDVIDMARIGNAFKQDLQLDIRQQIEPVRRTRGVQAPAHQFVAAGLDDILSVTVNEARQACRFVQSKRVPFAANGSVNDLVFVDTFNEETILP